MNNITNDVAKATKNADFIFYAINPDIRFINRLGLVVIAIFVFFVFFVVCSCISGKNL